MKAYQLISIILIVVLFFYFNAEVPNCKSVLKDDDKNFFKVSGNSMLPKIKSGEYCVCEKKENYNLKDIVIYFPNINGEYVGVAHRIIEIKNNSFYLRGDNNNFIEGPIEKENIYCSIEEVPRYKTIF